MKKQGGIKVVLLMCLGIFVCMLDSTIMNITLPAIQDDLKTTLETSSWMLNVYTMTIAVLAIPMARFADMFGKNRFYLVGLFVFGLGSALCGLADSGSFLIAARFIQSLGAAILIPLSMVIGVAAMPMEKRVLSLTLLGATQGLATALGPTVGGLITEKLSWHWVFYVNVPLCLAAMILSLFLLRIKGEAKLHARIDWLGLVFSTMTIFPLNFVLIKGNEWGWMSTYSISCYVVSAFSLVLFLVIENKVKDPMVNLALFKDRQFVGSVLTVTTGFIFFIGVMVLLPQFLTTFQGKTELEAALLLTPASAAIFIFANFAGMLVKKIGFVIPIMIGFSIMGVSYYLLRHLTIESSSLDIILLCSLLGLGFSFVISSATLASTSSFEGELLTASQSVFSMLRQVGVVLAVAIFVAGLTNNIHDKQSTVVHYAENKVAQLNLPDSTKEIVIKKTKEKLQSENKKTEKQESFITEEQQNKMIDSNVKIILDQMPSEQREAAKPAVYEKVKAEVNAEVLKQQTEVQAYTKDVSHYAKNTFSKSFSALYQAGLPFVFICCLIGFVFIKRRSKKTIKSKEVAV
ncbi:MFS transporter [Bacillus sp. 03113]|uniref:MFS transporter n=1 Tax=Bacillus sp. 03113 TaxID=2578211 RepID=UPI001144893E|nr:MFS transporter [Bacillus sp. 03113]